MRKFIALLPLAVALITAAPAHADTPAERAVERAAVARYASYASTAHAYAHCSRAGRCTFTVRHYDGTCNTDSYVYAGRAVVRDTRVVSMYLTSNRCG